MSSFNSNHSLLWGLAGVGALLVTSTLLNQRRKMEFRGKTVIITGGSRGLGLVMARQFAQEGAAIALCARDEAELERAKADLQRYSSSIFTYPCDVTDKGQIEAFIGAAQQALGPIDILVNNAGTIMVGPVETMTEEDFKEAMDTIFWASFHTINAVLPQMRQRKGGRIVNIASFGGKVPVPHLLPYVTSKFALVGYSEGLRAELVKDSIYVTTVCPGLMRTGSPRNAYFKGQNEKEYAWFKVGDSIPFLAMSAEQSAKEILDACRHGKAEVILSVPAQIGSILHGVVPGLFTEMMGLVNTWLPEPGGIGQQRAKGKDSETGLTQSPLTILTAKAEANNNQLGS